MSYQLIRETWPVAREKHRCIWCGESIGVGERHRHEISRYDGLQDHRWHPECNDEAQESFANGDEEFEPYSAPRPVAEAVKENHNA